MTITSATMSRAIRWTATTMLVACAGFWIWFVVSVGLSEGGLATAPVAGFVAAFALLVACAFARPRAGGVLALAAAIFAAWFFDSASARLMLALPLGLAGAGLLWPRGGVRAEQPVHRRAKPDTEERTG